MAARKFWVDEGWIEPSSLSVAAFSVHQTGSEDCLSRKSFVGGRHRWKGVRSEFFGLLGRGTEDGGTGLSENRPIPGGLVWDLAIGWNGSAVGTEHSGQ